MRVATIAAAAVITGIAGMASASDTGAPAPPATAPAIAAPTPAGAFRLTRVIEPVDATFRLGDPLSILRSGYGGSLIDLFPFVGGIFHISGGGRLFGRPGRLRVYDPAPLRLLPSLRMSGPRMSRRLSPTMLLGFGRTVDRGLAFGIDAGVTMGRMGLSSDRFGRLNRRRLDALDGRGRSTGVNQLARVTALWRF